MLSQNSMEQLLLQLEWPKFASFVFFFIVLLRFTSACLLVPEPRPVERDSPNMLTIALVGRAPLRRRPQHGNLFARVGAAPLVEHARVVLKDQLLML